MLADENDKSLRDHQQRLSIKEDELQCMTDRYHDMENRLTDSEKLVNTLKSEVRLWVCLFHVVR